MLEVCADSVRSVRIAVEAGAQRIELCESLDVGGITPSEELQQVVRDQIDVPLIVLIRFRDGDFVFSEFEVERMMEDAKGAVQRGADGIAIGGLDHRHSLDIPFLTMVASALPKVELVMHRGFDQVPDREHALDQLVELGFRRILTSGGYATALDGIESLRSLNSYANKRIEILPAGGIHSGNAKQILEIAQCHQLHGSFRVRSSSLGNPKFPDRASILGTRKILDEYLGLR
jgi:copper homeostasis protein